MKEKMKYYDKEIERRKASLIEAFTVIIVFLVSFTFGYIVGAQEVSKNEEVQVKAGERISK